MILYTPLVSLAETFESTLPAMSRVTYSRWICGSLVECMERNFRNVKGTP